MPTYTTFQHNIVMTLPQILTQNFPGLQPYWNQGEALASMNATRNYLISHFDENNVDLAWNIEGQSRRIYCGSGHHMRVPDLSLPKFAGLEDSYRLCGTKLHAMTENQELMNREPMLGAYLRFSDMVMQSAESDHPDRFGFSSDVVYNTVQTLFNTFQNVPTSAQLDSLRSTHPELYAAGMKIQEFMDAFAAYNAPDMLEKPEGTAEEIRQKKQERNQRFNRLMKAAEDFSATPKEHVFDFFRETQNGENLGLLRGFVYDEKLKTNHLAALEQMKAQKKLMDAGASREEVRVLWDCMVLTKTIQSELSGSGKDISKLLEPFKTQYNKLNQLYQQCREKYENGFSSAEEKDEMIRKYGQVFEELRDSTKSFTLQALTAKEGSPERREQEIAYETTKEFMQTCISEALVAESTFNRSVRLKDRKIGLEESGKWLNRSALVPHYSVLKQSKTAYLGRKDSAEYRDYQAMMKAMDIVAKEAHARKKSEKARDELAENCHLAMQHGSAWLDVVLRKKPADFAGEKALRAGKLRAICVLGAMKSLNPEKADMLRKKTAGLFGHELSWNEISSYAKKQYDVNPNYKRYFELHTGSKAQEIPDSKLNEYAAKAMAALFYIDNPNKKFNLSVPRSHAKDLMNSPDFQAAVQAAGPRKIREILVRGDMSEVAKLTAGTRERYAVTDKTVNSFLRLSDELKLPDPAANPAIYQKNPGLRAVVGNRDLQAVIRALSDHEPGNSREVFKTAEKFLLSKSVINGGLAIAPYTEKVFKAVALAAQSGDDVAKQRAQNLVDKYNFTRGTMPGLYGYVDLKDFEEKKQPEAENQAPAL